MPWSTASTVAPITSSFPISTRPATARRARSSSCASSTTRRAGARVRSRCAPTSTSTRRSTATGATWLDRQAIAREPAHRRVGRIRRRGARRDDARAEHLIGQGLAERQGATASSSPATFSTRCASANSKPSARSSPPRRGRPFRPAATGDYITGAYRQRLALASGRFAMIDDGLGFRLVPWSPSLERTARPARLRSRPRRRRHRLELRPQAGSRLVSTSGPCPKDQYFFASLRRLAIAVRLPLNADGQAIFLTL